MLPQLNATEIRIIGCLIEKSVITPDQYPLTLNALRNACNQKSSRDPVTNLTAGEIQHAVRDLQDKHLLRIDENFKSRVEKYTQRLCNTRYSDLHFDEAELAVVCLLLLRGAQTPGELRARAGRLHSFADNAAVTKTLAGLAERAGGAVVVQLPRRAGRQDSEYMHLFGGPIDVEALARAAPPAPVRRATGNDLEERVSRLEAEVERLRALLDERGPSD